MLNTFTRNCLVEIHKANKTIRDNLARIVGFEAAMDATFDEFYNATPNNNLILGHNEFAEVRPTPTILEEVRQMIVELKIKGSIRERSNGLIELRTSALGSIYGRTREEIELKLNKRLKEAKRKPTKEKATAPLLSVFFRNNYIPYKINQQLTSGSIQRLESTFKYIVERKFDKPLNLYKSHEIETFLYSIPQTRKRQITQNLFNNMFKRAVAESLIKFNPSASIEKTKHIANEGSALSFDEQKQFFQFLFSNEKISARNKLYFVFVYLTGTRRNEALAAVSSDIDYANNTLQINGTKTFGSLRKIPLFPLVVKLLSKLKPDKDNKFFPVSEFYVDEIFRNCMRELNFNHKLHDLRHTFGTIQNCVESINIKTVSLWMGHKTIQTTLEIYTHPEKLDMGTFLRGDISEKQKVKIYRKKYAEVLKIIEDYIV